MKLRRTFQGRYCHEEFLVALLVFCVPYRLFTAPAAQPSGESENLRNNSIAIPASQRFHRNFAPIVRDSVACLPVGINCERRSIDDVDLSGIIEERSARDSFGSATRNSPSPPRENDGVAEGIFPFHFCTSPCSFSRSSHLLISLHDRE